jgi:hypothetical protein
MRAFHVIKSLQAGLRGLRPSLYPVTQRCLSNGQPLPSEPESEQPRIMKIENGEKVILSRYVIYSEPA